MGKLSELKLAFTDTETTGLDESKHEIIEIACLVYDPVTDSVIEEWEKKISPTHIETADADALKINGYKDNAAAYTGRLKSALIKYNSLVKDCAIVGQNIDFDIRFITRAMKEFDIKPNWNHRRKLDTLSIAWPIVSKTEIPGLGLGHLCEHFGVSNIGAHSALVDCRRTYEVYKCLMNMYKKLDQ